jgi:iron complex transport system substrate-binding protein
MSRRREIFIRAVPRIDRVRVASLLPSATETVCALGGRDLLAGVSHECDFPPVVTCLPVLTRPRYGIPAAANREVYAAALKHGPGSASAAIDQTIREIRLDALSPYLLDQELLARLQPDIVLTQDLCEVCAPSLDEVCAAVGTLCGPGTRVVSLTPRRLADVWQDIRTVGAALRLDNAALELTSRLQARLQAVRDRVHSARVRFRTVLTIEWFEPVMNSGLWIPELVEAAGGIECESVQQGSGQPLAVQPGARSRVLTYAELESIDPDVIVLKPCGFKLEDGLRELAVLLHSTPWPRWRAAHTGEVYLMDGSAYFNRPGPRLAESCELLAAALHPALFPEIRERHRHEVLRIGRSLEAAPW